MKQMILIGMLVWVVGVYADENVCIKYKQELKCKKDNVCKWHADMCIRKDNKNVDDKKGISSGIDETDSTKTYKED